MRKLTVALVCGLLSASVVRADCPDATNQITNCGFEVNLAGWINSSATMTRSTEAARTGSASLSLEAINAINPAEAWHDCMALAPSTVYNFGAFFRLSSSSAGSPEYCDVELLAFTTGDCTGATVYPTTANVNPAVGVWTKSQGSFNTGTSYASFRPVIRCQNAGAIFTVLTDDVYVGTGQVPVELTGFSAD